MSKKYDIAIIGAGPGGYVAGIRARQLGLSVALIEKYRPGGVCLNWGCIPSKSLIHSADTYRKVLKTDKWGLKIDTTAFEYSKVHAESRVVAETLSKGVQGLIRRNKIDYYDASARISSKDTIDITDTNKKKSSITAKNIIIATGSSPREIPGYAFDGSRILSSTDMLSLTKLPKKLAILGAGAIGVEFAFVANAFGVEVILIEMLPRVLPNEDSELAEEFKKQLESQGIQIILSTKAGTPTIKKDGLTIPLTSGNKQSVLEVDSVLVGVGRVPNTNDIGLENVDLETDKGYIPVGDYYQTKVPSIFAIGDVVNTPALAHVASKEGEMVVEHIAGKSSETGVDLDLIPSAVYSEPQVASFGKKERDLEQSKRPYTKKIFPYRGAGKSIAVGASEGFVKILTDEQTNEILGCHVMGKEATEIIHSLLLAKQSELLPEDIAKMIHAHPTISETVLEVSKSVGGSAIHI